MLVVMVAVGLIVGAVGPPPALAASPASTQAAPTPAHPAAQAATAPAPTAAPLEATDRYVPITPARLRESRALLGPASEPVDVLGRAGVPAQGVRAVTLVVTGRSSAPGSVTVWPGDGRARPAAGTLAVGPDRTSTTTAVVPVGPDGRLAVASAPGPGQVGIDVTGWFPTASTVAVPGPIRLFDSRSTTVDGRDARRGPVTAGVVRPLQIGGRGAGPAPAGSSVLLAVHGARASVPSGLTLWPSGTPQPMVPSAPIDPGAETHDLVFTGVGRDGVVDVALADGLTDVVVDLVALAPARSAMTPVTPARILDTRPGTVTVDGRDSATGALAAGIDRRLDVVGRAGVPPSASAVIAHVTMTAPPTAPAPVELRGWGAGAPPPGPSVVTGPGETRAGLVVLPVAPDGSVVLRSDGGPADVAFDVQGWIRDPSRALG